MRMLKIMSDIENLKKQMLEEIDNLNPAQLSRLCLNVVKKILKKDPVDNTIKNSFEQSKEVLVNLMIEHNIKIHSDNEEK